MEKQIYNRRKTLFGNEETAALYYAAKDIIFEYEIYKPYSIYDDETISSLTLFNCFRYSKNKITHQIQVEYFCFDKKQWIKEVHKYSKGGFKRCVNIPFFRFSKFFLNNAQRTAFSYVTHYIKKHSYAYSKADNIQELLVKFFSRKQPVMQSAFNHQKRIVKWLWAEFWDKNIISMTLRIDGYRNANLWHYLRYQSRIEVLYKIANEHPNLLPLLAYVKPEYWKCSDLFSYQNWVRSRDKQPFILYAKCQDKMLCESKGQWRWLKKQSRIVVDQCFLHVNQWQ